jgi:hypothetical protein
MKLNATFWKDYMEGKIKVKIKGRQIVKMR